VAADVGQLSTSSSNRQAAAAVLQGVPVQLSQSTPPGQLSQGTPVQLSRLGLALGWVGFVLFGPVWSVFFRFGLFGPFYSVWVRFGSVCTL